MKKTIATILAGVTFCWAMSTFADVGSFLKDAANTTSQISNAVNGPEKASISDIKDSGSDYANKSVEVSGTVVELKSDGMGNYSVVISDDSGNTLNCTTSKLPSVKLDAKVKVTGNYNGQAVAATTIDDGSSLF